MKKPGKDGCNTYLDTNIAIYYLDKRMTEDAIRTVVQQMETGETAISVITELELLGFKGMTDQERVRAIALRDSVNVIELDSKIKETTIDVRTERRIKLPDAIIAATAIAYDLTLLSRNEKDFGSIKGLKYINPFVRKGN